MVHIDFAKDKSDCHTVLDVKPCVGGISLVICNYETSLQMGKITESGYANVVAKMNFYQPESIDILIETLQQVKSKLLPKG